MIPSPSQADDSFLQTMASEQVTLCKSRYERLPMDKPPMPYAQISVTMKADGQYKLVCQDERNTLETGIFPYPEIVLAMDDALHKLHATPGADDAQT